VFGLASTSLAVAFLTLATNIRMIRAAQEPEIKPTRRKRRQRLEDYAPRRATEPAAEPAPALVVRHRLVWPRTGTASGDSGKIRTTHSHQEGRLEGRPSWFAGSFVGADQTVSSVRPQTHHTPLLPTLLFPR
jgi:hypothetical protein